MIYVIWLRGYGFLRGTDIFCFDSEATAEAVRKFYGRRARIMPVDNVVNDSQKAALLELEKALLEQENKPRWAG